MVDEVESVITGLKSVLQTVAQGKDESVAELIF